MKTNPFSNLLDELIKLETLQSVLGNQYQDSVSSSLAEELALKDYISKQNIKDSYNVKDIDKGLDISNWLSSNTGEVISIDKKKYNVYEVIRTCMDFITTGLKGKVTISSTTGEEKQVNPYSFIMLVLLLKLSRSKRLRNFIQNQTDVKMIIYKESFKYLEEESVLVTEITPLYNDLLLIVKVFSKENVLTSNVIKNIICLMDK